MQSRYQHVTVWAEKRFDASSADDGNNASAFGRFERMVVRELSAYGAVDAEIVRSGTDTMRDIKFTCRRPLTSDEWTTAITIAADACGVMSDRNMWSFE